MKTPEATPQERLEALLDLFPAAGADRECFRVIDAAALPPPYHDLLVHNHHMTVTLEAHQGSGLLLDVLEERREGILYARRLLLRVAAPGAPGRASRLALGGIMRIHLEHCQEAVRRQILQGQTPLGRILIEHEVLRWIEPEAYLRVRLEGGFPELRAGGDDGRSSVESGYSYGRLATIFCDGEPAVELLEIVAPETDRTADGAAQETA